jgi:hypothetical protein
VNCGNRFSDRTGDTDASGLLECQHQVTLVQTEPTELLAERDSEQS